MKGFGFLDNFLLFGQQKLAPVRTNLNFGETGVRGFAPNLQGKCLEFLDPIQPRSIGAINIVPNMESQTPKTGNSNGHYSLLAITKTNVP